MPSHSDPCSHRTAQQQHPPPGNPFAMTESDQRERASPPSGSSHKAAVPTAAQGVRLGADRRYSTQAASIHYWLVVSCDDGRSAMLFITIANGCLPHQRENVSFQSDANRLGKVSTSAAHLHHHNRLRSTTKPPSTRLAHRFGNEFSAVSRP